ncbi:MAG: VOC family protein [Planctomycetales bacterium]|nr:VOC family protein [Planctomycetales bacterium]
MSTASSIPVRFHLSLNVSDLPRAVAFFESVLGVPPAKQRVDYAKFELDSPPLVFSLEPRSPSEHGSLNHAGFRFADTASLVEAQRRLEAAGVSTQREEGVECCYARQTKFWVHDLDRRLWEFYVLEGDLDHRGAGQSLDAMIGLEAASAEPVAQPVVYEHRMGTPFSLPTQPCDEIRLRGTFNVPTTDEQIADVLRQVHAALKPGGVVQLHILTAEEVISDEVLMGGPAAHVRHAPVRQSLMQALETADFANIALTTFRSGACFQFAGLPLRETKIVARRLLEPSSETATLVYKGPFAEIRDDEGFTWRRGVPSSIRCSHWESLKLSGVTDMFTEVPDVAPIAKCGG